MGDLSRIVITAHHRQLRLWYGVPAYLKKYIYNDSEPSLPLGDVLSSDDVSTSSDDSDIFRGAPVCAIYSDSLLSDQSTIDDLDCVSLSKSKGFDGLLDVIDTASSLDKRVGFVWF